MNQQEERGTQPQLGPLRPHFQGMGSLGNLSSLGRPYFIFADMIVPVSLLPALHISHDQKIPVYPTYVLAHPHAEK